MMVFLHYNRIGGCCGDDCSRHVIVKWEKKIVYHNQSLLVATMVGSNLFLKFRIQNLNCSNANTNHLIEMMMMMMESNKNICETTCRVSLVYCFVEFGFWFFGLSSYNFEFLTWNYNMSSSCLNTWW